MKHFLLLTAVIFLFFSYHHFSQARGENGECRQRERYGKYLPRILRKRAPFEITLGIIFLGFAGGLICCSSII